MSPSRKRRAQDVTNLTKNILICMADGSEPLDVMQAAEIFRKSAGTTTKIASSQQRGKLIHLKNYLSITCDISFAQASSIKWDILVLPGGNKGVAQMLEDVSFVTLMGQCKEHQTVIAAMGASATKILPAIGLIDPLGPSCYTPRDCPVVVREGDSVWTAAGLGTATELILVVAQHVLGTYEANRLAEQYHKQIVVCHYVSDDLSITEDAISRRNTLTPAKTKAFNFTAFWNVIWPALTEQGWSSGSDSTCHFINEKKQVFGSPKEVVLYLESLSDRASVDILKLSQSTREKAVCESDPLFHHVVWTRLQKLGWGRKRRTNSYVFWAPDEVLGKQPKLVEADVIPFLLRDSKWRTKMNILAIVDLFHSCQRTRAKIGGSEVDPNLVEQETKRRFPAMEFY